MPRIAAEENDCHRTLELSGELSRPIPVRKSSRGEGQRKRNGTTKDNPWAPSRRRMPTIIETASSVGNVLTFSPVIASYQPSRRLPWKNKEERHRTAGENGNDGEGEAEEIAREEKEAAGNKRTDEGAKGDCKSSAILPRKGVLATRLPVTRISPFSPSLSLSLSRSSFIPASPRDRS